MADKSVHEAKNEQFAGLMLMKQRADESHDEIESAQETLTDLTHLFFIHGTRGAAVTPAQYIDDLLSRRYANVCLNADRQVAAAARAADRAAILERASREMELIRNCESVVRACGLGGARHG
jgi:hypothetical protein